MKKWIKFAAMSCVVASFTSSFTISQNTFAATGKATLEKSEKASLEKNAEVAPQAKPDADMKKVLNALASLKPKPIQDLTPTQARLQPTPADAVQKVLKEEGKSITPEPGVTVKNIEIPGPAGNIQARIYTPEKGQGPFPVIVYYHGGGFVIADLDTYDATPRALARKVNAIVVSSDYRHAPEHKFPAAHQDAFAAYKWVTENAQNWNGDSKNVAVVGESAGGNLAANVSIMARDNQVQLPVYEVLVYPVAGNDMNTYSYQQNANAKPLNKPMMGWFFKNTISSPKDAQNPMLNLVDADLKGLPPTTIITAQIDPLRSDGELLAKKLKKAGVETNYKNYDGVTHEFFGMAPVVEKAEEAQNYAATQLQSALNKNK